jgi:hypothetical protein
MVQRDRAAWSGWVAELAVRYLWKPRHNRADDYRSVNSTAIAAVAAVVVGIGAAVYVGVLIADDGRPPVEIALPERPVIVRGDYPSVPVSVAPVLATSASTPPSPSAADPGRPPANRSQPAEAATTHPPAARTKKPVWEQRVIASTSVLTTGQSWSTNRLRLTVTGSGDLVLQDQGKTVWQTGTTSGVKLVMQNDGHLVLYDAGNGTAWSSGTAGNPGAVLILRADGNMVVSLNARILFQTGTGD